MEAPRMAQKKSDATTTVFQLRLSAELLALASEVARLSTATESVVIRASLKAALPLLKNSPQLVRQLEAGLPLPPEFAQSGASLRVSDSQRATVEKLADAYGLKAEDVLREALERGLPAVETVTVLRQTKDATGETVSPELAEQLIAVHPEVSGYHRAMVEASARERGLRMKLARVASHPDGAKALEELHAKDEELRAKGLLTPFGLNVNAPVKAAESPMAYPAAPPPTVTNPTAGTPGAKPKRIKGKK